MLCVSVFCFVCVWEIWRGGGRQNRWMSNGKGVQLEIRRLRKVGPTLLL